jgi:hypothetical protein
MQVVPLLFGQETDRPGRDEGEGGSVPACGQRGNAMGPAGACARHWARAVVALVLVLAR